VFPRSTVPDVPDPDLLLDTVPMIRPASAAPSDFLERALTAGAAASHTLEWFRSAHTGRRAS
jgi:hypothetical protein